MRQEIRRPSSAMVQIGGPKADAGRIGYRLGCFT
jgi:hypothetical protein